jgi:hypothetical protein
MEVHEKSPLGHSPASAMPAHDHAALPGTGVAASTTMRDFEDSTLWRVSAFERMRQETGTSGFQRLSGPTLLPSTLTADLDQIQRTQGGTDALEVLAACLRQRESALLYLRYAEFVWPITVFPQPMLYHSPRDLAQAAVAGLATLDLLEIEPPGVRPPGDWVQHRVGNTEHYHPLLPMLWAVALHGPRKRVLSEIGGTAAYRVLRLPPPELAAPGALLPSIERLHRETASLRAIGGWPGMDVERASRLVNALYLAGSLMVTRTAAAARTEPGLLRRLFGTRPR